MGPPSVHHSLSQGQAACSVPQRDLVVTADSAVLNRRGGHTGLGVHLVTLQPPIPLTRLEEEGGAEQPCKDQSRPFSFQSLDT